MNTKKPCPHCTSLDRQSNGQCACRNVLYRALKHATSLDKMTGTTVYNNELAAGATPTQAREIMRELVPALATSRTPRPTPAPEPSHAVLDDNGAFRCTCGFTGKGSRPSIQAHVSRALKAHAAA